jgi:predicted small secreted protein
MKILQRLMTSVLLLSLAVIFSGCGDTWRGVKEDTGRNVEKAGDAVTKAGKKISDD